MNIFGRFLIGGLSALAVCVGAVLLSATPAWAIACNGAECYIDSTRMVESDWESEIDTSWSSQPKEQTVNSNLVSATSGCDLWSDSRSLISSTYPAQNSGLYGCLISFGFGSPLVCPPKPDRASNGRVEVFYKDPNTGDLTYMYFFCLYPTDAYAPVERIVGRGKIYTHGRATFTQTGQEVNQALTRYDGGGQRHQDTGVIVRGVDLNNPEAYVGSWRPAFTASPNKKQNGDPNYGYYRLDWRLDYRVCLKWAFPAWLNQPVRNDCSIQGVDYETEPYTYACNLNPPLRSGIDRDAVFSPSRCETTWRCVVEPATAVNGFTDSLTVLRNGEDLLVDFPSFTVSGDAVRNVQNKRFLNTPLSTATPSTNYTYSDFVWREWDTYRETAVLAFNWASDSPREPFVWTTRFRYTAQYYLPTMDTVSSATEYRWVWGTTDCPQSVSSPSIEVVRSTNQASGV